MYSLGIDIGATKIYFVLMNKREPLKRLKIETPKKRIIEVLKKHIKKLISEVPRSKISGVGIGIPGFLDKKRGMVSELINLSELSNCPLASIIKKNFGLKVKLDNDANCFTLAESILGAGKKERIVIGITLGSGVGGGMVIKSRNYSETKGNLVIYEGANGSAGEIGHMTINFNGPKCVCGNRGCLEEYCSKKFFNRKKTTPRKAAYRAKQGVKSMIETYNKYGKYLGIGLANICNILDPNIIVVGGGIVNAWNLFAKTTEIEMRKRIVSPLSRKHVKIKRAELGEMAGSIGAALLLEI